MFTKIAIAILMIAQLAPSAAADDSTPITLSLTSSAAAKCVKPGETFNLHVIAQIKAGWHLYSIEQRPGGPVATRIALPAGQPFKLSGAVKAPSPFMDFDDNFGMDVKFYEESATFTLPVMVNLNAPPGRQRLQVTVFFQTCNGEVCLPPRTIKLEKFLEVAAPDARCKVRSRSKRSHEAEARP